MMMSAESKDLVRLNRILTDVEQSMSLLESGGNVLNKLKAAHDALQSFNNTALSLGFHELERAGTGLATYLSSQIGPDTNEEAIAVFGFALNALKEALQNAESEEDTFSFNVEEVMEILGETSSSPTEEEPAQDESISEYLTTKGPEPSPKKDRPSTESQTPIPSDYLNLQKIVSKLDGKVSFIPDDDSAGTFQLRFPADPSTLKQIERLLSSTDPSTMFLPQLTQDDTRTEEVLNTIREFMTALAAGDVKGARVILLLLAKQQHQAGLYDEIGSITRDLHDSLRSFVDSLDSALKGLVDDEIAGTENRLERVLKHTEQAANTTLDHVEAMQTRNRDDLVRIAQLQLFLRKFKVTGQAQERMAAILDLLDELKKSVMETRSDLVKVLTAQDYQDLTGQVIMKTTELLKDLELKLVKVISTFGFKVEYMTQKWDEERGEGVPRDKEALHSQDDVDQLLAELGF